MTKDSNEKMYCDVRVQIIRFLKPYLHESLSLFYIKLLMTYGKYLLFVRIHLVGKIPGF